MFFTYCYSSETDMASESDTCGVGGARPQTLVMRLLIEQ